MNIEGIAAAFVSGAAGALGLGGGTVFLMYLAMKDVPQLKAQGMNLVFFLPCALISIILNSKHKLIDWKSAFPLAAGGLAGAIAGAELAEKIGGDSVRKIFAVLLLAVGFMQIKSVFSKKKTKEQKKSR